MNYLETLVNEKKIINATIEKVLITDNVLPYLSDAYKKLSYLQESIIKLTYIFKITFQEDLILLYSFSAHSQSVQKAIIELEEMGYLHSQKSQYGKCLALTQKGIYQIKYNNMCSSNPISYQQAIINRDEFNSSLFKYKCIFSSIIQDIFRDMTINLLNRYKAEETTFKRHYGKLQYIKNFVYKDFLLLSEDRKREDLIKMSIDSALIDKYSLITTFSQTFCNLYSEKYLIYTEESFWRNNKEYQQFRSYIKSKLMGNNIDIHISFNYLKEYHNTSKVEKKELEKFIYKSIIEMKTNYYRDSQIQIRNSLIEENKENIVLEKERYAYILDNSIKFFECKRRYLVSSNANIKEKEEAEINAVNEKIVILENQVEKLKDKLTKYEDELIFPKYLKTNENGSHIFTEQLLNIESLKRHGVYIKSINKSSIDIAFIPKEESSFTYSSLFNKFEKLYLFYLKVLRKYQIHIYIYTISEFKTKEIHKILGDVKEKANYIKEYKSMFAFFQDIHIIDLQYKLKERFEIFSKVALRMSENNYHD